MPKQDEGGTSDEVMRAFICYLKRQNHVEHPKGEQVQGSWVVSDEELCSCCIGKSASTLFNVHCRGLEHCSVLHNAPVKEVKNLVDIYTGKVERDEVKHFKTIEKQSCSYDK